MGRLRDICDDAMTRRRDVCDGATTRGICRIELTKDQHLRIQYIVVITCPDRKGIVIFCCIEQEEKTLEEDMSFCKFAMEECMEQRTYYTLQHLYI